jgi:hypothetical protein
MCPHPALRIRLYGLRTGPDWGGFRGSGGFSRGGARFESDLGHMFSLSVGSVSVAEPAGGPGAMSLGIQEESPFSGSWGLVR